MNRRLAVLAMLSLAAAGLVALADPPDEAQPEGTSSQVEKLQGTWRLLSLVRDGKRAEPTEIDNMRLIFSENQYTYKNQQGERKVGTFKLRPDRKPPLLETTYAEAPDEGKTVLRIYQWIDKQTLKLCSPGPDERAPDNFEAPQGSGREVAVWKKTDG